MKGAGETAVVTTGAKLEAERVEEVKASSWASTVAEGVHSSVHTLHASVEVRQQRSCQKQR